MHIYILDQFINVLSIQTIANLTVQMGSRDLTSLPPSSSLSFLDADASLKAKTIVITDHYKEYVNK